MSRKSESNTFISLSVLNSIEISKRSELPAIHNEQQQLLVDNPEKTEETTNANENVEGLIEDSDEKSPNSANNQRRVRFPDDFSHLCTVSYIHEPYTNRQLISLGVILQKYCSVCQQLQIRPLNSLLNQLSAMDDGRTSFFDRLDCLKIVNEKVDRKHIEAIEEILSRCRFHTLVLESSTIDDTTITEFFEIIEYYESCTHIILSNIRSINYHGYGALTRYLRKTVSLERLDMNSIRFDDNTLFSFTKAVRLSSTLYELHVDSCLLNGKLLQKFIQHLRLCIRLRELYLCNNRISVEDSLLINELIRTCGQFLLLLDLRGNILQDSGMSHIASQLSQYDENHSHENHLHKISFEANQITQQGVGFLAKSLLHNRTIKSLNLSHNNLTNEGLILLRDALLANETINELILRDCRLTDQAAIALAEFIAESTTIQYIDLRENVFKASGICGMAIAIRNNKSLLKLDFDPIVSTPTNLRHSSNYNNEQKSHTNSFLSFQNLRRITSGFSSFTSSTPLQGSTNAVGGGGTRELLEQKAKWMNDISAICQRNMLIYEEKLRLEAEKKNNLNSSTNEVDSNVTKSEDTESNRLISNENDDLLIVKNVLEDIIQMVDVLQIEESENIQDLSTNTDEITTHLEDTDVLTVDSIELVTNDNFQDQAEPNACVENSDGIDETFIDNNRKLRHSDSFCLQRKKVKVRDEDISDDDC